MVIKALEPVQRKLPRLSSRISTCRAWTASRCSAGSNDTYPDIEVIVITAFSETDLAIRALQLGASDFITKPVRDDALTVAIERAGQRYSNRKELKDYTDILEQRWMETSEELAKTFLFQKNLIDSSIDGIIACDEHEKVIVFNRSMEQILGYHKDDVIRKKQLHAFFSQREGEKVRSALYSDVFGGKNRLFLFETSMVDKGGARIPVQMSASVLFDDDRQIGIVGFFRDLREVRRLIEQAADQARMLHQDKMISLGKLAASVVHEINNPLTGILNYAKLMSRILSSGGLPGDSVAKFQGYLSLMQSELERCSKIVSNLLSFSRKSGLEPSSVDINELLNKCISLSGHKLALQNIRVETNLAGEIPAILGDFNQLQQCLINIIFNACDAMPEGGVLTFESSFNPVKRMIYIIVRDTGCGISEDDLPYIFDPFFTTKIEGKGTGLGLSTTFGIIHRHKGAIRVESEPGKGTVFKIELPASVKA